MKNHNIEFYNKYAERLYEQYESILFRNVHSNWLPLLSDLLGNQALDIGAGSGRDAIALVKLGFDVTAVEPAYGLNQLGNKNCENKVKWIDDSLPSLSLLQEKKFNLILVSAVWMHLTQEQQQSSLSRISSLLCDGGMVIITVRHGDFDDERTTELIDIGNTLKKSKVLGLTCILNRHDEDKLNRSSITWQTLVFAKKGDSL